MKYTIRKSRRRMTCLSITVTLIYILSGCAAKETRLEHSVDDASLFDNLPEGLSIDESMELPEVNAIPAIYEVALAAPTQDGIEAFLNEVGDPARKINVSDCDGSQQISAETSNGTFMLNRNFSQKYTGFSFYYDTEMDSWYKSEYVLNYYDTNGEDNAHRSGNKVFFHNADRYQEPKEFAFASVESAEETVRQKLELLDIHNLLLSRVLFLDHSIMAQVENETNAAAQAALENGEEIFPKGPDGEYLVGELKGQWTEADDCYMFVFTGGTDGIPTARCEKMDKTTFFVPTTVIVRINASGITYINTINPWNVIEQVQQPDEILSAQQALVRGKEIVQDILVKEDQVITRLSLRYYNVQDGQRWLFTPVWEITVCRKDVVDYYPEPKDLYYYVLIDAITGDEI